MITFQEILGTHTGAPEKEREKYWTTNNDRAITKYEYTNRFLFPRNDGRKFL